MVHEQSGHVGKIRVLVADDSRIHTQLLTDALQRDRGLTVVEGNSDVKSLLTDAQLHSIDVVVVSATLDGFPGRGFEVVRQLRSANSQVRAVMLLDGSTREVILEAFRSGAAGILSRHEQLETLSRCIRSVFEGQIWANSHQIKYALEALACVPTVRAVDSNGLNLLSKREADVVQCLAEGLTNREIAERLGLSQHTVKNYLFRVFDKLGVSSRVELLFMTLSQENNQQGVEGHRSPGSLAKRSEAPSSHQNHQAAQQGDLGAQLALAEFHAVRGSGTDLVQADMWYSIILDQIEEIRQSLRAAMTPEELLEAEKRAAKAFVRTMKIAPSPSHGMAKRRGAAVSGASSAD